MCLEENEGGTLTLSRSISVIKNLKHVYCYIKVNLFSSY